MLDDLTYRVHSPSRERTVGPGLRLGKRRGPGVRIDHWKEQWTISPYLVLGMYTLCNGDFGFLRVVHSTNEETRSSTLHVLKQKMKMKPPLRGHTGLGALKIFKIPSPFGDLEISQIEGGSHIHRMVLHRVINGGRVDQTSCFVVVTLSNYTIRRPIGLQK